MESTHITRRKALVGASAGALGAFTALTANTSTLAVAEPKSTELSGNYHIGVGKADVTGAIAGQGMMGYSDLSQVAEGLLQRCWARAYLVVDESGQRVVFVNVDLALIFESHRVGVMEALRKKFGGLYTEKNVNLNATHNHNSCGGTAWDYAYQLASFGFQKNSYDAEVAGIVAAIVAAHQNLAPGTIFLGHDELHNASVNRSQAAFDLNDADDRQLFPEKIDPQVTTLQFRRGTEVIGSINWFATHGTSLTDANFMISTDNKGYASYRAETETPGSIHAFPQTNAGDMTPNLWLKKLHPGGPTADHRTNCSMIGERQYQAGLRAQRNHRPLTGGVASATRYLNMSDIAIDGKYTPHGRRARTSPAMEGISALATSMEDNTRSQISFLKEGMKNPLAQLLVGPALKPREVNPVYRDSQAPKLIAVPFGLLPPRSWVQQVVPIQLVRLGQLVLCAAPAEFTIMAGLRVRRVVAEALGVDLANVLLQGYSNGYSQYVTTPEEYGAQQYEGASTLFGRYTLCAYMQEFDRLARAMKTNSTLSKGPKPQNTDRDLINLLPPLPFDQPVRGHHFGQVISGPSSSVKPGQKVTVRFCGAHPNNRIRRGDTYFTVDKKETHGWKRVFNDNDWCTELRWKRPPGEESASVITIEWRVPVATLPGEYRVVYFGDVRSAKGLRAITGTVKVTVS